MLGSGKDMGRSFRGFWGPGVVGGLPRVSSLSRVWILPRVPPRHETWNGRTGPEGYQAGVGVGVLVLGWA